MFFIIRNPKNLPLDLAKGITIRRAVSRIGLYRLNTSEILLNEYFLANKNKSLKTICKELLLNGEVVFQKDHLVFKFKTTDSDKLAKFITYGNGKIRGSKILQYALFR